MALWEWEFRRSTWENMHGRFHLTTHPETETLVLSGDSSDHGHGADAERLAKLYGLFFDLLRQLAGRRQDDGVGTLVRVLNPARDGRQTCVSKAGLWGIQRGGGVRFGSQGHLSLLGRVVIHTSRGIRKAAVLPLPVSATPMMSRFCRPMGMACR